MKKNPDQIWLNSIKKQLTKYISNPKWDYVNLSDFNLSIITQIMNCNDINQLSLLIDERLVNSIFETIKKSFSKIKLTTGNSSEREL